MGRYAGAVAGVGVPLAVLALVGESTGSASSARAGCAWLGPHPSVLRGTARGDVDRDGRPDRVSVVARYDARAGCRFALRVDLATGRVLVHRLSDPIIGGRPRVLRQLAWPRLLGIAKIDPLLGAQPVVEIGTGASSISAGVFAMRGLGLVRLVGGSFSSCDSQAACTADCWRGRGSGMVVSSFAAAGSHGWTVSRLFYRLVGDRFRLLRPLTPQFRVRRLAALPEFRGGELSVFASCMVSRSR
jgi:hypothetical protein